MKKTEIHEEMVESFSQWHVTLHANSHRKPLKDSSWADRGVVHVKLGETTEDEMFFLSLVVSLQNNFAGHASVTENRAWAKMLHLVCSFETWRGRRHIYGTGWRLLQSQSLSNRCGVNLPKPWSQAWYFLEHLCKDQVCPRHQHMQEQRMWENMTLWKGSCVLGARSGWGQDCRSSPHLLQSTDLPFAWYQRGWQFLPCLQHTPWNQDHLGLTNCLANVTQPLTRCWDQTLVLPFFPHKHLFSYWQLKLQICPFICKYNIGV